jgi:hypothetical protein
MVASPESRTPIEGELLLTEGGAMAATGAVTRRHPHAHVCETEREYLIELDVPDVDVGTSSPRTRRTARSRSARRA